MYSLHRIAAFSLTCFLMSGCSLTVSNLGPAKKYEATVVTLRDTRPENEKVAERAGMTSSIIELGDKNFKPSILSYLMSELANQKPANVAKVDFDLSHFRIIDAFPHRMGAAQAGAMAGVMASYGITTVQEISNESDAILCVISGSLNGKPVKAEAATPYNMSLASVSVRNDSHWIAAVKESLRKAVTALYAQAE
jgi:hypothetical protein